jgi:hypothetical protein
MWKRKYELAVHTFEGHPVVPLDSPLLHSGERGIPSPHPMPAAASLYHFVAESRHGHKDENKERNREFCGCSINGPVIYS